MIKKSKPPDTKIAIVGGGLAGCLAAHALMDLQKKKILGDDQDLKIVIFEKQAALCGQHTWSFHENDVAEQMHSWLNPLVSKKWPSYQVDFPSFSKVLQSGYSSIRSQDLEKKTHALTHHPKMLIELNTQATILDSTQIVVDEKVQNFDYVLNCSGWRPQLNRKKLDGFQKFVGLEVTLESPHLLKNPIVMDARVPQLDGYRFLYVLPLSENTLLIEDTYYSNDPSLDEAVIINRIKEYASENHWKIKYILYKEVGSLLIPSGSKDLNGPSPVKGLPVGVQADQYQPVTGYSTPYILNDLELIIQHVIKKTTAPELEKILQLRKKQNSFQKNFYFLLNRMLFGAAQPNERYKILQRFYTFDEKLIQRFYSGKTHFLDMLRILIGRPPVPVGRAMKVFFNP